MIPIFEPFLDGNEKKYLLDCIESNWISSQGQYILKFEKALADFHDLEYAVVTSNCTTALHLSLKSFNIGFGDEVICPDLTFIAPANMVSLSGAKLVLVDIDPVTLNIDPDLIEKKINKNTRAIIVVHQFGHAANMDKIMHIASKYNLKIIEDNAESIGAKYKNKLLGTIGHLSTNSFFANKIITCGEGGVLLTNDKNIAMKCRELRDHGMSHKKKYHHIDLGYNYRMTNMQAAIGLAQIEKINHIIKIRKEQMDFYYRTLSNISFISLRQFAEWCEPVHWMMTIFLDVSIDRKHFISYMMDNKIECRPMINPVHNAEHFKSIFNPNEFNNSIKISNSGVHLPSSTSLTKKELIYICETIRNY